MLQNAYFLAKIGADTAENERNFAKKLPGAGGADGAGRAGAPRVAVPQVLLPAHGRDGRAPRPVPREFWPARLDRANLTKFGKIILAIF